MRGGGLSPCSTSARSRGAAAVGILPFGQNARHELKINKLPCSVDRWRTLHFQFLARAATCVSHSRTILSSYLPTENFTAHSHYVLLQQYYCNHSTTLQYFWRQYICKLQDLSSAMSDFYRGNAYISPPLCAPDIPEHKLAKNQLPTKENQDVYEAATT